MPVMKVGRPGAARKPKRRSNRSTQAPSMAASYH
jgi:hypothetical protein